MRKLDRNREPPEDGPMCEMLWNDPMDMPGMVPNKVRWTVQLQLTHFPRNCSGLGVSLPQRASLPVQHDRLRAAAVRLHV